MAILKYLLLSLLPLCNAHFEVKCRSSRGFNEDATKGMEGHGSAANSIQNRLHVTIGAEARVLQGIYRGITDNFREV